MCADRCVHRCDSRAKHAPSECRNRGWDSHSHPERRMIFDRQSRFSKLLSSLPEERAHRAALPILPPPCPKCTHTPKRHRCTHTLFTGGHGWEKTRTEGLKATWRDLPWVQSPRGQVLRQARTHRVCSQVHGCAMPRHTCALGGTHTDHEERQVPSSLVQRSCSLTLLMNLGRSWPLQAFVSPGKREGCGCD